MLPHESTEAQKAVRLPCPVSFWARARPNAIAFEWPDGSRTSYGELDLRIEQAGTQIEAALNGKRRRLALTEHPSVGFVACLWACLRRGVTFFPLSSRAGSKRQRRQLSIFGEETHLHDAQLHRDVLLDPQRESMPADTISASMPALVIATSGSRGEPKLAVSSYANHLHSALGAAANMPLSRTSRWLLCLPLCHVGGLAILFRCALAGAAVVVDDKAALFDQCRRRRITHLSAVATQLRRAVQLTSHADDASLSGVTALLGGGPLPQELIEQAMRYGLNICCSYGLTEMASQVTATRPGSTDGYATAGWVLPGRELKLSDAGEICVRGKACFLGYLGTDDQLETDRDAAGWFYTGDLGRIEADGALKLLGRRDRQMSVGGEQVHPESIEECLMTHPRVTRAAVVPVEDVEYGMRPVAFVEATRLEEALCAQLHAYCRASLSGLATPIAFLPWPENCRETLKPPLEALRRAAADWLGARGFPPMNFDGVSSARC